MSRINSAAGRAGREGPRWTGRRAHARPGRGLGGSWRPAAQL